MTLEVGDNVIIKCGVGGKPFAIKLVPVETGDTAILIPTLGKTVALKAGAVEAGDVVAVLQVNGKPVVVSTEGSGGGGTPPIPASLASFTPVYGRRDEAINYSLFGDNFPVAAPFNRLSVRLSKSTETMITALDAKTINTINGHWTIPHDATLGLWNVDYHDNKVTPDLQLPDAFTVLNEQPWLTDVQEAYVEDVHNHWSSHVLTGKYLHMLTGINAGQRYLILDNTAHSRFYITIPSAMANAGFEHDPTWTGNPGLVYGWNASTISYLSTDAHTGGSSYRFPQQYAYLGQADNYMPPGEHFYAPYMSKLTFYAKWNLPPGGDPPYLVFHYGSGEAESFFLCTPQTHDWMRVEYVLDQNDALGFYIQVIRGWYAGDDTGIWLDDFQIEGAGITPYTMGFRILDQYRIEEAGGTEILPEY